MNEKRLGDILLEQKLITAGQLAAALETQKTSKLNEPIGRVLTRLGYLEESRLQEILDQFRKREQFTSILLKNNFLSKEDLDIAIRMSKDERLPLAKVLLNLDFLSDEMLAKTVALYYDRPFLHLKGVKAEVKPTVGQAIIAFSSDDRKLTPVSVDGRIVTVAMTRPLDPSELRRLENKIKMKVETVIAPEGEILAAQQMLVQTAASQEMEKVVDIPDDIMEIMAGETDEPDIELDARKVTEKDSLLVKLVNKIIYDAYSHRASDIHIEPYPGKKDIIVRTRVDGCCEIYRTLPYKYKYAIPSRLKIMAELDISERRRPQDGKIDFKKFGPAPVELRIATMPTVGHLEDVVIRLLHGGEPVPFDHLGLTKRNRDCFEDAIKQPYGMVLVVGPTGSGKTTTLHSAIATINTTHTKIWTAEDPVEIVQDGLRQVQVNAKIGLTFAAALRSFLRLDPDVIMVGEMRDFETAAIAVEASLTGHLVFSTLHTNSAPETLTRLLDMGLDPFSFSDSLLCILAQRLARRLCDRCKISYTPEEAELQEIIAEYGAEAFLASGINRQSIVLARPAGCDHCLQSGYKGRLGIHELLVCSDNMKKLIKMKRETEVIRMQTMAEGMTTLKQDGILKVLEGHTDIHEIRRVCIR